MVLGAGYVPEEIGADVDSEGLPLTAAGGADVLVNVKLAKQRLLDALDGDKDAAIAAWGDRGSQHIRTSELEELITMTKDSVIEVELVEAEVTEAV